MSRRPVRPPRRGASSYSRVLGTPQAANGYSVTIQSPANGAVFRVLRPTVEYVPVADLGSTVDVQIEWRVSPPTGTEKSGWDPALPKYAQTVLAVSSGDVHTIQPPADLVQTTWYIRMRAGKASTGVWSYWTDKNRRLDVQAVLGSVAAYIAMNVGVPSKPTLGAYAYADMNVGRDLVSRFSSSSSYADMNVGIVPGWKLVASYSDMNIHPVIEILSRAIYSDVNVTTDQPSPVIWWIRPEEGKEGYVFNIYGHGFGDFQNQYDGVVKLGEFTCQISRWETVAANSALGKIIKRGAALEPDEITTEYGWIVAVVPSGAVSAMVKVVLEDA